MSGKLLPLVCPYCGGFPEPWVYGYEEEHPPGPKRGPAFVDGYSCWGFGCGGEWDQRGQPVKPPAVTT